MAKLIPKQIADPGNWRGKTLDRMRKLINETNPDIVEERKWIKRGNPAGGPVWSGDGIICTGETYKSVVKRTFAKGASLTDPARLFNSSLDGNVRRAIDIHEGKEIDADAFKALVRAAIASMHPPESRSKPMSLEIYLAYVLACVVLACELITLVPGPKVIDAIKKPRSIPEHLAGRHAAHRAVEFDLTLVAYRGQLPGVYRSFNSLAAFSLMISARTSSLIGSFSNSASQRSG